MEFNYNDVLPLLMNKFVLVTIFIFFLSLSKHIAMVYVDTTADAELMKQYKWPSCSFFSKVAYKLEFLVLFSDTWFCVSPKFVWATLSLAETPTLIEGEGEVL